MYIYIYIWRNIYEEIHTYECNPVDIFLLEIYINRHTQGKNPNDLIYLIV